MLSIIITFIISSATLISLYPIAVKFGFVDRPCNRKRHQGNVPLIGGISLFISVALILSIYPHLIPHSQEFLCCSTILVVIGIMDDYLDLSVISRLLVIIGVSIGLVITLDFKIDYLGDLFGTGDIKFSAFALVFTVIAIISSLTAFNMIDGMDGLLGGLTCVTLTGLAFLFWFYGRANLMIFCLVFITALIPYLLCNLQLLPKYNIKVFMGDSGTIFIGFTVIWLLIEASQLNGQHLMQQKINPVTALWLIALPLLDMTVTIMRRVAKKKSPFKADRAHLHHIFTRLGLSHNYTLFTICFFALICALVGILGELFAVAEVFMFIAFLLLFSVYYYLYCHIWKVTVFVRKLFGINKNINQP